MNVIFCDRRNIAVFSPEFSATTKSQHAKIHMEWLDAMLFRAVC